jgi:hypothetical protein
MNHKLWSSRENIMALISFKNNKKENNKLHVKARLEDDSSGKGLTKRSSRLDEPFSNRTGLINGLSIAEQDPNIHRGNKSSKDKKKVGASAALLKK